MFKHYIYYCAAVFGNCGAAKLQWSRSDLLESMAISAEWREAYHPGDDWSCHDLPARKGVSQAYDNRSID